MENDTIVNGTELCVVHDGGRWIQQVPRPSLAERGSYGEFF